MLEVRRHGTRGPVVAVLHGGPGAPGSVGGLAAALADGFTVLEPFQRRSGAVPLTVDRHVEDLRETLDALAPDAPVRVVGWSWGAMLALSFAAAHPARVAALALVGCGTYDEASRATYRARVEAALGPAGRARRAALKAALAATTDPVARDALLEEAGALVDRAQAVDPLPDDGPPSPDVDARGHDETWADVLARQADGTEPAAFAAIRAPALLLQGEADPHPGPEIHASLARFVTGLAYRPLPDCGHTPWRERRARGPFLAALTAFLRAPRR